MPTPELDAWQAVDRLWRLLGFTLRLGASPEASGAPGERAAALRVAAREVLGRAGLKLEVRGELPRSPAVLVANHLSWFDPLVLASLVPVSPVAKDEVGTWPVVGRRARALGANFVDRYSAHSGVGTLLRARRALRAGVSVLNFPEGTTTRGDLVLPFRPGIFGLARLAGVPVVPVRLEVDPALTWVGPAPLLPHLWRLCATAQPTVRVRFLEALSPWSGPDTDAAEAARRAILRPASSRPRSLHAAATLSA
jgi:1-acyl-sn-glycerol-3-phosphate acyltransferase